jgi:hypothetical protein
LLNKQVRRKRKRDMAKRKFDLEKLPHERIPKKTSIGRRPKMSSMNKHRKRSWKAKNRGGM